MLVSQADLNELKKRLSTPSDIVILSHRNPDGDALGSSIGWSLYLKKYLHSTTIIYPSEYPKAFNYLPNVDDCIIYDFESSKAIDAIKKADIICCLDFNSLDRIDKMSDAVMASDAYKVLIDHHLYPEQFADFVYSDTEASSTCELVYRCIEALGDDNHVTPNIAECLFTGLITDTGSFKYATTDETFRVASELKKRGVDDNQLQDLIFNRYTPKQMKLLGHCIYNRMELMPEYKTGIITLTKQDYTDYKISRGDTEGIVNYILMLDGYQIAAFITEQPTIVKLSLRSKGDFSVQEIASKYFNGGGHKNAAGGGVYTTLDNVVNKFKEVIAKHVDKSI